MNNFGKAIFAFAVVSVMVLGAYFASKAQAGGGKEPPFLPFNFFQQQSPFQPTLFDLQRQEGVL
jgi:hypothetical protein